MSNTEDNILGKNNVNIEDLFSHNEPELETYVSKVKAGKATTVNNGWNTKKENIIRGWLEENQIYSWLLKEESKRYNRYDHYLMVPLIVLMASSGIATLTSTSFSEDTIRAFNLASGCIQMLIAGLALTKQWYNPGKIAQICQIIAKKYAVMNNNFNLILGEDVTERGNGTVYIREINKERNDLYENTPNVSSATWNKFRKELKSGNLLDIESSILLRKTVLANLKKKGIEVNEEDVDKMSIVGDVPENIKETNVDKPTIDSIKDNQSGDTILDIEEQPYEKTKTSGSLRRRQKETKEQLELKKEIQNNLANGKNILFNINHL